MKVRFEVEVENTEIWDILPESTDEIWRGANGKKFLLRDPLTESLTIVTCNRGIDDEHKYVDKWHFMLPVNTRIIDGDGKEEKGVVEMIGEKIVYETHSIIDEIRDMQKTLLDACKNASAVPPVGISENTLLEALRIVSKKEE